MLAISSLQGQTGNATEAVKVLKTRWVDALQEADTSRLESILAVDYIDSDEGGGRTDKGGLVALKNGDLKIQSIGTRQTQLCLNATRR